MKNIFLGAFLFISSVLLAQENKEVAPTNLIVETLPKFPGGNRAFSKYISSSLTYPEIARIIGVDGKVIVSFVVDKDGKLVEVEPKSCVGAGCEAEAVRILEESPKWTPGIQDGKAVRVSYTLPITFSNPKAQFSLNELKKSKYNFVFLLQEKEYSLADCEALKIKNFKSEWVETSMPHPNQDKFIDSGKSETYVLKIKDAYYKDFIGNN